MVDSLKGNTKMIKFFSIISVIAVAVTTAFVANKNNVCECAACTCAPICPCVVIEAEEMPIAEPLS